MNIKKLIGHQVSLKVDFIFEMVFSEDKETLKDFLIGITGKKIKSVKSITRDFTLGRYKRWSKQGILDIQAKLEDETLVNIEMQVQDHHNIIKRSIYYLCGLYYNSIKSRGKYKDTKHTIVISILDYIQFPSTKHYVIHTDMSLLSEDFNGTVERVRDLNDELEIYIVELPKFRASEHNLNRKQNQWLIAVDANNVEELCEATKRNKEIMKAMEIVERLTSNKNVLKMLNRKLDDKRNLEDAKAFAFDSGVEQTKIELIKNAINMNMKIEDIAKIVDLSIEEVEKILKNIK